MLGLAQKMFLNQRKLAEPESSAKKSPASWPLLDKLVLQKRLAYVDYALSERLLSGLDLADEATAALICHLSIAVRQGHVCIYVDDQNVWPDPSFSWRESVEDAGYESASGEDEELQQIKCLIQKGAKSLPPDLVALSALQTPAGHAPLYRNGPLFYFQKYWHYETQFIKQFNLMCAWSPKVSPARSLVQSAIQEMAKTGRLLPEQGEAIRSACEKCITIIAGGPGTGKTYTAGLLIKIFLESLTEEQRRKCQIALAAPTGKAASNLQGSLIKAMGTESPLLQVKAKTLHSLLGIRGGKPPKDSSKTLSADLIVVDESSMIDVRLMSYLFAAVKPGARLILLGDGHQLPAVEAGSIFADLIKAAGEAGLSIVTNLKKCLRAELKGIIDFAELVNDGDSIQAAERLDDQSFHGVSRAHLGKQKASTNEIQNALLDIASQHYKVANPSKMAPEEYLIHFNKFRILTPLRKGPFGFEELNRKLLKHMRDLSKGQQHFIAPIILVSNDHRLELFNGEVGALVRSNIEETGDASLNAGDYAIFPSKDDCQGLRKLPAMLLPKFEYAYCMSVHKSQGSEFGHVLLMLPPGSEVFGREVLYTGVTRAKQKLEIWAPDEVLEATIRKKSNRLSGIAQNFLIS